MAFNACSLNRTTFNATCWGTHRTEVEEQALDQVEHTPGISRPENIRDSRLRDYLLRRERDAEENYAEMEQLEINISATAFGETQTIHADNSPQVFAPLVTINNLTVADCSPNVAIEGLEINYRE